MKLSNQFKGHDFTNDEPDFLPNGKLFKGTLADYFFGKEMRAPSCALPLFPNTAQLIKAAPGKGLRITWLGHSTTLIQIDGAAILTDPIWSERASPVSWEGPRRFHPPPLALDALPKIDAVIISHDRYNHLDMDTVRALAARGVPFHVPLRIGAHLAKWGVPASQIFEHDGRESADIKLLSKDIHLVSTPGRHFSGRGLLWRVGTHWTSWSIVGPAHRVFFSSDTGFIEHFRETAKRFGPFDVAMIEIGQWHPSWGDIHLGPKGALDAFALLDARLFSPCSIGHLGAALESLHGLRAPRNYRTQSLADLPGLHELRRSGGSGARWHEALAVGPERNGVAAIFSARARAWDQLLRHRERLLGGDE